MSSTTTLFLLLLLTTLPPIAFTTPTAYDILESYDFPVGLLPKGVTGYELNPETGEFKAFLPNNCKFTIDGYDLEYKSTITGVISKDRLNNLTGVSVKVFLFWLNIVEVDNRGGELQFSVGIASANFPLEGFDESPQCGCGFDCDDASFSSLLLSYFVVS